ncbi:MAG: hypothetical protein QOF14_3389 [Hyphomicrobiales bacterium]|jgi:hypothetical protein|nr:hypothetical protein [Hyphomicrobiales bacterium]
MKRILLAILFAALTTVAQAQPFATVKPGKEAWWLRTSFNPMHTEIRGTPVAKIHPTWCKATEYTRELMPKKEMEEEGSGKLMDEVGLSFSVTANFDRSKTKQIALVGVYQTCGGQKGRFLLVIDEDTQKIRFVAATPGKTQFAVLAPDKRDIVILYCMECDVGGTLRWNAKKKAFGWVQSRGH